MEKRYLILISLVFLGLTYAIFPTITGFAIEDTSEDESIVLPDLAPKDDLIIYNPSFEEERIESSSKPLNWFWNTEWDSRDEDTEKWDTTLVSLDKEIKHGGGKSLKHDTKLVNNYYSIKSKTFKVKPGKIYRVEFFAKTNATMWPTPLIGWVIYDSEGRSLVTAAEGILFNSTHAWEFDYSICELCGGGDTFNIKTSEDNNWLKISFDFKPYGEAEKAALFIDETGGGGSWSWWFIDDFSIKEIE